ncbi:MAG: hypothetical protein ACI4JM_06920 [Oscillospiraceae bacterium]
MKRKIFIAVLSLLMLSICGIIFYNESIVEGDIILINNHQNGSEINGYRNAGIFIDKYGKIYDYDFSEISDDITFEEEMEKFSDIMEQSEGTESNFTENDMKYIYSMLKKVDENSDFTYGNQHMWDYGQDTLYGIRYDKDNQPHKIKLYSYGDVDEIPVDRNSQKIYDYYISKIK